MSPQEVSIGEVRMSFSGGQLPPKRSEQIATLTFERLQRLAEGLPEMDRHLEIGSINAGPIRVAFDSMDDESIATEAATEIYRAVLSSIW